jgi:hypothetical protein
MDEQSKHPQAVPVGKPFEDRFGPVRSTQYELINKGEVESFLIGDKRGRRYIITDSWFDYVERQRHKEAAGEIRVASPNPRARSYQPGGHAPAEDNAR